MNFIFSVVGMISIVFIRSMDKSSFVLFFTVVSFIFYVFDPFFLACYSLINNQAILLNNTSFLSDTEGFIMFIGLGYILMRLFRKSKT